MKSMIQPGQLEQVLLLMRGQRRMLDPNLAALYGVETKNLNKVIQHKEAGRIGTSAFMGRHSDRASIAVPVRDSVKP